MYVAEERTGQRARTGTAARARAARPAPLPERVRRWAHRHRWFLAVAGLGAVLRAVTVAGYRPILWFPDSYTYVVTAMRPRPDLVRPAGYSMFLRLLEPLHDFGAVAIAQHLLGLATGALVYVTVLRLGGRAWLGALAAAPVLLDAYQIELEHLLVSDTLFMFLVASAVCLAVWRPPGQGGAVAIGLLIAAAALTRTVGLPLIAVFAFFVLRYGSREVRRTRLLGAFALAALVPIVAYGGWFYATHHRIGIVGSNGVFLYARTMSFADCSIMKPPADLAVLCDRRPPEERPPSQEYIWNPESPLVKLPGITFLRETDALAGRFAVLAIRSQPGDYLRSTLTELSRTFTWGRPVYPDAEIYGYYEFPETTPPPPGRYPAVVGKRFAERYERGPITVRIVEPYAGVMRAYQDLVRLPGAVLLGVLLVPPVLAVAGRARSARWGLPWASAWALLIAPAATAEFDYRYVLPAVPLACLAAALAAIHRPKA